MIGTTEQERLGYDASNYYSVTVSSAGVVTHDATGAKHIFVGPAAANNTATMGAEMLTNSSFTSDLSSWTDSGSTWSWSAGGALHTAGTASNLSQNVSVVSGSTYEVRVNTSGRTAGTISVALGAVSFLESGSAGAFTAASFRRTAVANTTGTVALTITPSSTYDGKIDDISLKQVTLGTFPTSFAIGEGGLATFDVRGSMSSSSLYLGAGSGVSCTSSATNNVFLGISAGASNTTGYNNVFIGKSSGYSNTTAFQNTAVGLGSLVSCTSGCNNSAIGCSALYSTTTSNGAVAIGTNAAYSNVSGIGLVAIGMNAAYSQTTSYSTSIGYQSGRFLADGTTSLVTASNCCYIGASTKASADSVTNENVFGYNATGIGSNSTMIGSSAVTKCQIYGDMILDKTITAGGTTGAQTINKTCGSVNFAASATSLVVTNSRVTTSSVIVATVATNDSTMKTVTAVAGSGSFTLYANAAATAETRVNWIVIN